MEDTGTLQELRSFHATVTVGRKCAMIDSALNIGCHPIGAGSITGDAPLRSESKQGGHYTGVIVAVRR